MLGIVLPTTVTTSTAVDIGPVSAVDIRVAVEIIVIVYGYIVISSPAAVIAPASAPGGSHSETDPEGKGHASRIVPRRWIRNGRIWVGWRAVHDSGVIAGNVDDLWIGLFDDDYVFAFDNLCLDFHLLARLQVPLIFGLRAHSLHSLHYVGLLGKESVAEIGSPLNVIRQAFDNVRHCS
jgi:hypothetical protein